MVKLYLDENVNILLASLLQPRKISVITTLESRMLGKNDREQLDFATGLDAAIVTHNRADFEHLFREYFSTTIRYAQPTRSLVNLEVLNLLAQQVQELVNSEQEAGHHKAEWQAQSGLASDIYFYRLHAQGYTETRKMLLLC